MNFIVLMAYISLLALGLTDNIRGPLYPDIVEYFNLNQTQGSLFFILSSLFGAFGTLLAKYLLSKFRIQTTHGFGLLVMSAGMALMSISNNFNFFLLSTAIFGLSMGIMGTMQNFMVAEFSDLPLRRRLLSGLHSMYGLASFMAPVLVSLMAKNNYSWKNVFLYSALVPLIIAVLSFVKKMNTASFENIQKERSESPQIKSKVKFEYLILAFILTGYVVAEIMISARMAYFLKVNNQFDLSLRNFYVTAFFALLLIGRIIFTFVELKLNLKKQLMVSAFFSILFLVLGIHLEPFFLVLSGLSMAPFYPMMVTYISELYPHDKDQVLVVCLFIQSLGIVFMHMAVGILTDYFNPQIAMMVGPFFLLVSLLLFLFQKQNINDNNK